MDKMDINYELYKVFYYVAKTLSFSEASKKLFISQSAVSQSVKVLEKRLNQQLFFRSTKRVQLTREGEMLFKHIEPAVNLINLGENQILESHSLSGGQICIGASDTICRYYLVPYFKQFHSLYPNVHIKVTNATSLECMNLLAKGEVDIVIVNTPNNNIEKAPTAFSIHSFNDVFVANKAFFPDLMNRMVSLKELAKHPILMLDKQSTTSEFLHKMFLGEQIELLPSIELSSNDLLIDLARIGLGIACVPDYCIKSDDPDLFVIPLENALPARRIAVAYDDKNESKIITQFVNLIQTDI